MCLTTVSSSPTGIQVGVVITQYNARSAFFGNKHLHHEVDGLHNTDLKDVYLMGIPQYSHSN